MQRWVSSSVSQPVLFCSSILFQNGQALRIIWRVSWILKPFTLFPTNLFPCAQMDNKEKYKCYIAHICLIGRKRNFHWTVLICWKWFFVFCSHYLLSCISTCKQTFQETFRHYWHKEWDLTWASNNWKTSCHPKQLYSVFLLNSA